MGCPYPSTSDRSITVRRAEACSAFRSNCSGSTTDLVIESVWGQVDSSRPGHCSRLGIDGHLRKEGRVRPRLEHAFSHEMNQGDLVFNSVLKLDPESVAISGFSICNRTQQGLLQRRRMIILVEIKGDPEAGLIHWRLGQI